MQSTVHDAACKGSHCTCTLSNTPEFRETDPFTMSPWMTWNAEMMHASPTTILLFSTIFSSYWLPSPLLSVWTERVGVICWDVSVGWYSLLMWTNQMPQYRSHTVDWSEPFRVAKYEWLKPWWVTGAFSVDYKWRRPKISLLIEWRE